MLSILVSLIKLCLQYNLTHRRLLCKRLQKSFRMIALNQTTATKFGLNGSASAVVVQNNTRISIPIYIEEAIPDDCAFIPAGVAGTNELGSNYGPVEVDAG